MVVHYLRFSSRPARNVLRFHSRKFSGSSATPKRTRLFKWVAAGSIGAFAGCAAMEYYYPSSITGLLPPAVNDLLMVVYSSNDLEKVALYPARYKIPTTYESTTNTDTNVPKPQNKEISSPSTQVSENTETSAPIKNKKKIEDHVIVTAPVEDTVEEMTGGCLFEMPKSNEQLEVNEPETITESVGCPFELPETLTESVVCPFEFPEEWIVVSTLESPEEDVTDPLHDIQTEGSATDPAVVIAEVDETEIIMDALNTLDYEPVLSDTVLELLVGKAASREKAVIATISRLENAMASVVNEVQVALEHHNITSALVSAAKLNAQSVSEATDKDTAKIILNKLMESSAAVSNAFEKGEKIDAAVSDAFTKLSEVIEKAEQFSLKGPVSAARALLGKSRNDYYNSCQTAQEHQVDHALLAHYQRSVVNRKKVLEQELAILRDHFPKQHNQLNQTFDPSTHNRAQVDELNTLITYLSNKVGRLERDLEQQQASELEKLKLVAEAQKHDDGRILEERLKAQKEQLRYKYELQEQTEVENAVAAARDESARHAERQTELLKQEMNEKAEQQIRDLTAFWSDEAALRESCVETEYQCKLERSTSLLSGVADMLDTQSERYKQTLQHRRLLNLTTVIFQTINSGENLDVVRLKASLETLKAEFNDDALVTVVTSTIPDNPCSTSFAQLKDRLGELDSKCRNTALVTSEDCGIGSHILSRAMSLLTLRDQTYDRKPEDGGSITLYYLYKAQSEMKKNNLDLATRYLNQLVGKPRTIVTDWLNDARTLLELQQSAEILMNYAKIKNDTL